MATWNIQISASNSVAKEFDTLQQALKWLKKCQGSCSIAHNPTNTEAFIGTVKQAIDWVKFEIQMANESHPYAPRR